MTESSAERAGHQPPPEDDLDRLVSDFERLIRLMRRATSPDGLSLTAASVLSRLDDLGPHRLSDLASAEGVTQPAMTQLVSRLERCGLAERAGDPADGRVVLVGITAAGRDRIHQRRRTRAAKLRDLLAGLPEEDRAAVARSLRVADRLAGSMTGSAGWGTDPSGVGRAIGDRSGRGGDGPARDRAGESDDEVDAAGGGPGRDEHEG